ncbi:trichohyalin-like [Anneissia japonica]|uniref:trichohyalin-like n=1 Tax=Anneissia japonica TaxID=1529436 RepID=UPI0014255CFC|nr:trichohyalin-like [Anneissia japonica]
MINVGSINLDYDKKVQKDGQLKPSLKDLRPEDKTRIANLIRELAKTGREKDNATNELESERKKYQLQEKQSKEQLELVANERDTVKQHYIECQKLLAQYQNQLRAEQEKAEEAVKKASEQAELAQAQQKMAEQNAAWTAQMAVEKERLTMLSKERSPAKPRNNTIRDDQQYSDAEKMIYTAPNGVHNLRDLQHRLNSRHPTHQIHDIQHRVTNNPTEKLHPDDPEDVPLPFNPALTSTNRSQHVLSRNSQSLQTSKTLVHQSHPNHFKDEQWSVNDVADPRRSADKFHILEPQIDETPTFEDEVTPMSPVERQVYNDTAPQYRKVYERMTPDQRWNELLLHREKLRQEQDWLRQKLHEQEELLQQRKVEKTFKHGTQHHLMSINTEQYQEPEWQPKVQTTKDVPNDYDLKDFDKVSNSRRLMQKSRISEPSDELMYEDSNSRTRTSTQSNQHYNRTRNHVTTQNHKLLTRKARGKYLPFQNENKVPSSKVSMADKGSSPLYVNRETQTLSKEKYGDIAAQSDRRLLDISCDMTSPSESRGLDGSHHITAPSARRGLDVSCQVTAPSESRGLDGSHHITAPSARRGLDVSCQVTAPSERRGLDVSHGREFVPRYMENTSLLKDIVDTVEVTHSSRFDPLLVDCEPVPAQQNPLLVQRNPPSIHHDPQSIQRDPPSIHQGPPTVHRDPPSFQQDPPSVQRIITSRVAPSRKTFSSPDLFDIPGDEEIDKIEESQILEDIFFLK